MPFELIRKHEFEFAVYLPEKLEAARERPVVVFLHGYGERGNDPWSPLKVIGHYCWQSQLESIVVFPQCDLNHRGFFGQMESRVLEALHTVRREYALNHQIQPSISGFSMGGAGALWLNARNPGLFNSLVCIAPSISWTGEEEPSLPAAEAELWHNMFRDSDRTRSIAQQFQSARLLLVHGEHDDLVPIAETRALHNAAARSGAAVEFIELKNTGHEALEPSLYDINIFEWMNSSAFEATTATKFDATIGAASAAMAFDGTTATACDERLAS